MINLTIGVCTHNRKYIIDSTSKSLNEIKNIEKANLKIYDDCSDEYNIEYLKQLYPTAIKINRNDKNLGADCNTKEMYKDFLESDDEYFFNADSDMIFNQNVLELIEKTIKDLEKNNELVVFTVFNTPTHNKIKDYNDTLCIKKEIGAAGTVFSKKAIQIFMNSTEQYSGRLSIDNYFCKILKDYKIFCTNKSYAQHLGFVGQNSTITGIDYGKDFEIDTMTNAKSIIKIFEDTFVFGNEDIYSVMNRLCTSGRMGIRKLLYSIMLCIKYKIRRLLKNRGDK